MINNLVSVFGGSGFVLGEYCKQFSNVYIQPRNELVPKTNNILWGISTTDNYNVFGNIYIDIHTNQVLLLNMLESAKRKFGNDFIVNFISSWFVYGKVNELPAKEDDYCNPTGFYSITKRAAEQLLISYCTSHQIHYRILRLANVLGVIDHRASLKKNAVQFVIGEMVKNNPIKIYKQASWRDFIDVRDCAKAINLVISKGLQDEIYNVGNGIALNVKELFDYVKLISKASLVEEIDTPEFHSQVQVKDFWLDNNKLIRLGYLPQYSIWDTVEGIMEYYENQ